MCSLAGVKKSARLGRVISRCLQPVERAWSFCRDPVWITFDHDATLLEVDRWACATPVFYLDLGLISQLPSPLIHDGIHEHHVVIIGPINEVFDIDHCTIQYDSLMRHLSFLTPVAFEP